MNGNQTPAVREKDTEVAQALSRRTREVNLRENVEYTALHREVICGDSEAIKVLLQKGVDLDIKDETGNTPLQYAYYYSIDVAETLLENGANFELKNSSGQTPLHLAVADFHVATNRKKYAMSILLDRGANVNVRDHEGRTPLHNLLQCRYFHMDADDHEPHSMCKALLDQGALPDVQDIYGMTPLHIAVMYHSRKVVELLVNAGVNVNCRNNDGETPLMYAFSTHALKLLLQKGADVSAQDCKGRTPLHFMLQCKPVQSTQVDLVKVLLDNGADVNCKDASGKTPLHFALDSSFYQETTLKILLEMGARVNAEDNDKKAPLHVAAAAGQYMNAEDHKLMCKALLDHGASPDVPDVNDMTPLYYAVRSKSREVIEMLLNAGDVNFRNKLGETLLFYAMRHHRGVNCGTNGYTPLYPGMLFINIEVVELVLNAGADVNCRNNVGETPLMYSRTTHAMKLLIQKGAEVNARDFKGRTPLQYLAELDSRLPEGLINELLDWGASLTIKDYSGKSPLDNESLTSVYTRHAIKRSCVNLHSEVRMDLPHMYEFQKFHDSCREEVGRMKKERFGKHSLYDIFFQYQDPGYLSNKQLEGVVKLNRLKEQFPIYDSLLISTYTRAKERVDLCEVIVNVLETPLPREVMMYILTFVDHDSLINIIKAAK